MLIDALTTVVVPPASPIEAGPSARWKNIQSHLGIKLPVDFRDFGLAYGTGIFVEQGIVVFNAFSTSFVQKVNEALTVWRTLKEGEGDKEVPFSVFPNKPGLLPWGSDELGSGMFWLTEGNPDTWPILIRSRDNPKFHRFELKLTTFLSGLFSLKIALPQVWPKKMFKNPSKRRFQPLEVKPNKQRKNVYQLYLENGMKAGFWITHEAWESNCTDVHVVSINGQSSGRLPGEGSSGGNGRVIIDAYVNGTLTDHNVELPIASDHGFEAVDPPGWWHN